MLKFSDPVAKVPLIGPLYVKKLQKLNIKTIEDLLYHIPFRYLDLREQKKISTLKIGDKAVITGQMISIRNIYTRTKKLIQIAKLSDGDSLLDIVWFNQSYLVKTLKEGTFVSLSGKISNWSGKPALVSPEYEVIRNNEAQIHTQGLVPVYPETSGVSSKWLRAKINYVLKNIDDQDLGEFLDPKELKSLSLESFAHSLKNIHRPANLALIESSRQRLAFNELLKLQLGNNFRKLDWNKNKAAFKLKIKSQEISNFLGNLPFKLTKSQERSVKELLGDLAKEKPMNRLLTGDVGSGKTIVATVAMFASFLNGHQSVIMAPTQILAEQHFQTLNQIFSSYKIRVSLITSAIKKGDLGRNDIFVGTHSLIHEKIDFERVSFVAIDEQHRFGVEQRAHLIRKSQKKTIAPHVLTMTATPIPRTIALTLYGDLDLSTLDELPLGRQKIITWIVPPQKRSGAYQWIESKINEETIQAFIVCPIIEESQSEKMREVKAATIEYEKLQKIFRSKKVGLLHGRLKISDKESVLRDFKNKKIDILVTTPVVEVGIDIPNANIMLIEGAERFGLAQLHQLRGRVGRGDKKAYCLLFTKNSGSKVRSRLTALTKTHSGSELAELDLKLRGPGEVFGTKQSGFRELKIASWTDTELITKAKKFADKIAKTPRNYQKTLKFFGITKIAAN